MSGMRTILTSLTLVGAVGASYGVWAIIVPGEEKKKELLKNLPESNPARMEESRRRNALMLQVLKDAAETKDNIARGYGGQK
ncbi:Ubiquinol-cytochrome-c reductase complex assembly factor 3 [Triplophysa tibetana]|uniref:Ubiquinol-cytochrome-c reductase complex assembly factor 3 n=1 Tax=Triplophysa tibetana TaxID=1572043 RepID=A0A5A9N3U1_9TELE|nr:Ubiquinol-cytochrome-c reductase complex assembly factor 3 [Triplophysa tibetana]